MAFCNIGHWWKLRKIDQSLLQNAHLTPDDEMEMHSKSIRYIQFCFLGCDAVMHVWSFKSGANSILKFGNIKRNFLLFAI